MIVYNVTLSVEPTIESDFIAWLKNEHLPEVLATNLFIEGIVFKIFEAPNASSHNSYCVQYRLENWELFNQYNQEFAPALKQKTADKWGNNVLSFRTFLETV